MILMFISSTNGKLAELSELHYLDLKYYENYEITFSQLIANMVQNSVLFIVLILIIFSMKEAAKKYHIFQL